MKRTQTELSYQRAAIEGASPIGLMIVLFDTLAGDLRRAVTALKQNDIETRCRELNHGILVLGQLENWLDLENGGESAATLARFYTYLRAKMMEAAITKSAKLLEVQIEMLLHVRSSWQKLDTTPTPVGEMANQSVAVRSIESLDPPPEIPTERIRFSQSA